MNLSNKKNIKTILEKTAKKSYLFGRAYREAVIAKRSLKFDKYSRSEIDEQLVVFECFRGRKFTDSPKAIYDYMIENDDYSDYSFVWSFKKDCVEEYKEIANNPRTKIIKIGSEEYYKTFATAKYLVTNARLPRAFKKKKGQIYLQCWHGTPLKRLGMDIISQSAQERKVTREVIHNDAKKYDYLVTQSEFCSRKLSSAFDLKAIGNEQCILETGYPRNDYIINHSKHDEALVREKLGIPKDKKVILYAPTYRENQRDENNKYEQADSINFSKLRQAIGEDYVILYRAHYYIANQFNFEEHNGYVKDVSDYPEINDLYIVSDVLITDYSSVFFDYSNLKRPIIFYMNDLKSYKDDLRGLYLSVEELPGSIVMTQNELAGKITSIEDWFASEELKNKYEEFCSRYNYLDDGKASERVVKTVIKSKASKQGKVTLISRESDNITLDFKLLKEELESRGIVVEVLTKLLNKKMELSSIGYLGHLSKQKKAMNDSKVVVLDTYCIPVSMTKHPSDLEVVQIWHALSAIKKFGWQTVGKKDGTSPRVAKLMKMHEGYDHVLCASDVTANFFCEAFDIDKNKIVKLGLPRIDYILKQDTEVIKSILSRYPVLNNGKKNILYAPTFHKESPVDVRGLASAIDLDKYNLIVKLHPIDDAKAERPANSNIVYDSEYNSYDLLRVADIVVSDYSSFVVEATLTGKPIYLYVYDLNDYDKSTGFNVDYDKEAIGKYAFTDARELAESMNQEYDYESLKSFRDKYVDINTENCTKKLADYIELLLKK